MKRSIILIVLFSLSRLYSADFSIVEHEKCNELRLGNAETYNPNYWHQLSAGGSYTVQDHLFSSLKRSVIDDVNFNKQTINFLLLNKRIVPETLSENKSFSMS